AHVSAGGRAPGATGGHGEEQDPIRLAPDARQPGRRRNRVSVVAGELSHREIEELLGAYALDAVDPDEREAIELHLRDCPRCRAEVAEHREVASFLAHTGAPAPEGLWDKVVASLDASPPPLALAPVVPLARRRGISMRVAAAVGAVAAAAVGFLAFKVVDQGHRIDQVERRATVRDLALQAEGQPGARLAQLRSADGRFSVEVVLLPTGQGYVEGATLPRLPAGRVYQLWALAGTDKISAGVLGQ